MQPPESYYNITYCIINCRSKRPSIMPFSFSESTLPEEMEMTAQVPSFRLNVSNATTIFKEILSEKFRKRKSVEFENVVRDDSTGQISRRDASFGFFQMLVLKTLDAITVEQSDAYDTITIQKGPRWNTEMFSSQAFPSQNFSM